MASQTKLQEDSLTQNTLHTWRIPFTQEQHNIGNIPEPTINRVTYK